MSSLNIKCLFRYLDQRSTKQKFNPSSEKMSCSSLAQQLPRVRIGKVLKLRESKHHTFSVPQEGKTDAHLHENVGPSITEGLMEDEMMGCTAHNCIAAHTSMVKVVHLIKNGAREA
jgi:hypothetical protein